MLAPVSTGFSSEGLDFLDLAYGFILVLGGQASYEPVHQWGAIGMYH